MFSITFHGINALQALGISLVMSIVAYFVASFLAKKFDRSNGNETGPIAFMALVLGIIIANKVSFVWALFFGLSLKLFIVVGFILLLFIALSTWIIN